MKIERICKTCGTHFWVYESSLRCSNSSGNFCCRKCYNEYQKTLTGEKNNHYTSKVVKCANCGKEIKKTAWRLNHYKNPFCSIKCRSEYQHNYTEGEKNCNWKGGHKNYRGNFALVKRKYFSGNVFCAICGTFKDIHIHHIIPYKYTKDNSIKNLIPLCRKHHRIIETCTKDFIDLVEDKNVALFYLNQMLRERQLAVFAVIKRRLEERNKNGAKAKG